MLCRQLQTSGDQEEEGEWPNKHMVVVLHVEGQWEQVLRCAGHR